MMQLYEAFEIFVRRVIIWLTVTVRFILSRFTTTQNPEVVAERANVLITGSLRKLKGSFIYYRLKHELPKLIASIEQPLLPVREFKLGKVLHVNYSLAGGGAERQVVNTLLGMKQAGLDDIALICDRLHEFEGSDFYLSKLQDANVQVDKVRHVSLEVLSGADGLLKIAPGLSRLPISIRQGLINYIYEFYLRRPEVVHLWQDATCALGGIAACMTGVPKIILSTRNMAPYRFAYYSQYMELAYHVLGKNPNVRFINNSHEGKNDYIKWLGLPEKKFSVVLNGLYNSDVSGVSHDEIKIYRRKLGLKDDAVVIGSIFRFYPEKDPSLWMQTAAEIIKLAPDKNIVFLLVGTGPMLDLIKNLALRLGILEKLILPGIEPQPVLPLSVMDVFLLTSCHEGTPNVVIEAQLCGIPVVTTNAGGTSATVKSGITGWIVGSRDPGDLAKKVLDVLQDEPWLLNARRIAPQFAEAAFGVERMVAETLSIYDCYDGRTAAEAAN